MGRWSSKSKEKAEVSKGSEGRKETREKKRSPGEAGGGGGGGGRREKMSGGGGGREGSGGSRDEKEGRESKNSIVGTGFLHKSIG